MLPFCLGLLGFKRVRVVHVQLEHVRRCQRLLRVSIRRPAAVASTPSDAAVASFTPAHTSVANTSPDTSVANTLTDAATLLLSDAAYPLL